RKIIIRIPVIPGITDTDRNINQITEFVLSVNNVKEIDLLPYNHLGDSKYTRFNIPNRMAGLKLSPSNTIEKIKEKFENKNFKVKIGG
ncbi:MAG: glycyl-radical enzyme activating protein, partial [Candidatus Neomarinimicrobiota bacterium]